MRTEGERERASQNFPHILRLTLTYLFPPESAFTTQPHNAASAHCLCSAASVDGIRGSFQPQSIHGLILRGRTSLGCSVTTTSPGHSYPTSRCRERWKRHPMATFMAMRSIMGSCGDSKVAPTVNLRAVPSIA